MSNETNKDVPVYYLCPKKKIFSEMENRSYWEDTSWNGAEILIVSDHPVGFDSLDVVSKKEYDRVCEALKRVIGETYEVNKNR